MPAAVPEAASTETAAPEDGSDAVPAPVDASEPPVVGVTGPAGSVASSGPGPVLAAPQVVAPAAVTPAPPFQASSFTPSTSPTKPIAAVLAIVSLVIAGGLWEGAGRAATRAALDAHR
jgi:hypothetical protein